MLDNLGNANLNLRRSTGWYSQPIWFFNLKLMRYYYAIPKSNSEMVKIVEEMKRNDPDNRLIIRPSKEEYNLNKEIWNRFIRIAKMGGLDIEIE